MVRSYSADGAAGPFGEPNVSADGIGQHRLQRSRQIVAHVGHEEKSRAGHQLGGALSARRWEQRVVAAVYHEGRDVELLQPG